MVRGSPSMCIRHTSAPDSATDRRHLRIAAQRRDVVDEHRAGAGGGARHRGLGGVDRERRPTRCREPLDHRHHPPQLLVGRHRLGARPRRLPADVDEVRPLGRHALARARPPRPGRGTRPPSENESGVTFEHAHHRGPGEASTVEPDRLAAPARSSRAAISAVAASGRRPGARLRQRPRLRDGPGALGLGRRAAEAPARARVLRRPRPRPCRPAAPRTPRARSSRARAAASRAGRGRRGGRSGPDAAVWCASSTMRRISSSISRAISSE